MHGPRGGAVNWGTALQAGRSRLRFPMRLTQPVTEMSTRNISWWVKAIGTLGWQPYHLLVPIVGKSGALTSWNPQGLYRNCFTVTYIHTYVHTCPCTCAHTLYTYTQYIHFRRDHNLAFVPCCLRYPISEILSIQLASIMIHCYQTLRAHKFCLGASECVLILTFTIHSFLSFLYCQFSLTSGVNICMRLTDQWLISCVLLYS